MRTGTALVMLGSWLCIPGLASGAVYEFAPFDTALIYSKENKAVVTLSHYRYELNGRQHPDFGGTKTGEMLQDTNMIQFGLRQGITEDLSLALQTFKPYDLRSKYHASIYEDSRAQFQTLALASTLKYRIDKNWSFYGGVQLARTEIGARFNANMTGVGDLTIEKATDAEAGYLAGMTFELPEIALRATLSYQSKIDHEFQLTESGSLVNFVSGGLSERVTRKTTVTLPQAVGVDFETGINSTTLLTFSLLWRDWTEHHIRTQTVGDLANYPRDGFTYRLGFINQTTESVFTFAQLIYDKAIGGELNPLGPADGYRGILAGAAYDFGAVTMGFALEYGETDDVKDAAGTRFDDNPVLGANLLFEYAY